MLNWLSRPKVASSGRREIPAGLWIKCPRCAGLIYRRELDDLTGRNGGLEVIYTLTREQPTGWTGYHRRIDEELLREVAWPAQDRALAYICGPTQFVETAATSLVALGYDPARVKTERFGPTGGG